MAGALGLAAVSLTLGAAPTYDPWAWIGWGREIAHGSLSTVDGPSWKPLPVAVCTLFAPLGDAAPALWLVVARAGGLLGVAGVAALAARLTPRAAAVPAAAVAAVTLVLSGLNFQLPGDGYLGAAWAGNSEGLLVAAVTGAALAFDARRRALAWGLVVAAALLRPEIWPFAAGLGGWLWWREPRLRPWIVGGAVCVPVLWFGAELAGSGQLFRGAQRAQAITPDNPATTPSAARTVLSRARSYLPLVVQALVLLGAVSALAVALRRRPRPGRELGVLAVGGFGAAWVVLVAFMAQARLASGNPRYVLLAVAAAAVLAGVGAGRIAATAASHPTHPPVARGASVLVGLAVLGIVVLGALPQVRGAGRAAEHFRYEAAVDRSLAHLIRAAGGARPLLRCGAPVTGALEVTALAWRLDVPIRRVGLDPNPGAVVFRAAATLDDPPAPAAPVGVAVRARTGPWTVSAACPGATTSPRPLPS